MNTSSESKTEVRRVLQNWLKAFNENDNETLFSIYDVDAIYANAKSALRVGLEEIKLAFEHPRQGRLYFKEEALFPGKDMALIIGKFCFKTNTEKPQNGTGRVALVFRRSESGWKLLFDMDNCPPDCTSVGFENAKDTYFIA